MNIKRVRRFIEYSFFIAIILALIWLIPKNSQIVTLDTKKIVNEMIAHAQEKDKSMEAVDKMSQCLSQTIEDYAKKHNMIILPKQAVIAGDRDITLEIKSRVTQKCSVRSENFWRK